MKIRLVVRIQGEDSAWQREVERPYAGAPRADDWVYLAEGEDGEGLMATPVAVVTWENDGAVTLRFDVAGGGSYLEAFGFSPLR